MQSTFTIPEIRLTFFLESLFVLLVAGTWIFGHNISDGKIKKSFYVICFSLSCSPVTIPIAFMRSKVAVVKLSRLIKHFIFWEGKDIESWLVEELDYFKGLRYMVCSGLLLSVIAIYFIEAQLKVFDPIHVRWFAYIVVFASEFLAGAGLYVIVHISIVFWRLGKLSNCTIRVERHKYGIISTGIFLLECFLLGIFVWSFYQIPLLVTPIILQQPFIIGMFLNPGIFLTMSTLFVILLPLLICQIPLHNRMVEYKQDEIFSLEKILEELNPRNADDLSELRIQKLKFVQERLKIARSLPEWPFTPATLLKTSVSYILAILVTNVIGKTISKIMQT